MKKEFLKQSKGITLLALVITIIVLLILAGVAISMLSGENGILKRAAEAKEKTEEASAKEEIGLKSTELQMHFSTNAIKRYATNGYITNIEPGTTVEELKNDLPEGYKVYNTKSNGGNEITGEAEVKTQVTSGMEVKDANDNFIAKTIIFGDVDGNGVVENQDAISISLSMNVGGTTNVGAGSDCFMIAADVTGDGWIKPEDSTYVLESMIVGRTTS